MRSYSVKVSTKDLFPKEINGKITSLRHWQKEAHEYFVGENLIVLVSPPGSGKSAWVLHEISKRTQNSTPSMKGIIAIPQQAIAPSFRKIFQIDGVECAIGNDFIYENGGGVSSIKETLNFLKTPAEKIIKGCGDPANLLALCSHQTLGIITSDEFLKNEKNARLFDNTYLVIDEAHRLILVNDSTQKNSLGNKLSRLVNFLLRSSKNFGLILLTATPERGDNIPLIAEEFRKNFKWYYRRVDKHMEEMGILECLFDYRVYDENPIKEFLPQKDIISEPKENHLVIFSSKNTFWRRGEYNNFDDSLQLREDLTAYGFSVCDMVSEDTKEKHKRLFMDNPGQFNVVFTVNILREGVDWEVCSRIHHLAPGESSRLEIQTFGRMLRKATGKSKIREIFYYKNYNLNEVINSGEESVRCLFEDLKNQLILQIMMVEYLKPIKVKLPSLNKKEKGENTREKIKKTDLCDVFSSPEEYERAKKDFIDGYNNLEEKSETNIRNFLQKICVKYSVKEEDIEEVSNGFIALLFRHGTKKRIEVMPSVSLLRENGFDYMENLGGGLNDFLFGAEHNVKDFQKALEIYNDCFTLERYKKWLNEVNVFFGKTNFFPKNNSKNKNEIILARRLNCIKQNCKNDLILKNKLIDYIKDKKFKFSIEILEINLIGGKEDINIKKLANFLEENEKRPNSKANNLEENFLGKYIDDLRKGKKFFKNGKKSSGRKYNLYTEEKLKNTYLHKFNCSLFDYIFSPLKEKNSYSLPEVKKAIEDHYFSKQENPKLNKLCNKFNTKWKNIDGFLKRNHNMDLFSLIKKMDLYSTESNISEEKIINWLEEDFKINGKYPHAHSGIVLSAQKEWNGLTWNTINKSLTDGFNGLEGGSSLAILKAKCKNFRKLVSFKEAKQIVLNLKIKTAEEYKDRYKENNKLPPHPERTYQEWSGWCNFLSKQRDIRKFYETKEEAKSAIKKLKIKGQSSYRTSYKKDPRLPSNPNKFYNCSWSDLW